MTHNFTIQKWFWLFFCCLSFQMNVIIHSFNSLLKLELWNTHFYYLLLSYISLYAEKHFSIICHCQNSDRKESWKRKAETFTSSKPHQSNQKHSSHRERRLGKGWGKGIVLGMSMHLIVKTIHVWTKESGGSFALPKGIACEVSKK